MTTARMARERHLGLDEALRPILVAVGRDGGLSALRIARRLAQRQGVPLIVASIVEPPPFHALGSRKVMFVPAVIDAEVEARREEIHARLRSLRHALGTLSSEPVVEVMYGDAPACIRTLATEQHARLIVMGLGDHRLARRVLSAGTTWKTSRHAPCPVLGVSFGARDVPRHAVVATDFGAGSIHAAREAMAILADGSQVHLAHAWSRVETVLPVSALEAVNAEYAASLPERFSRFREALGKTDHLVFHASALTGRPAEAILALAHAQRADLVVVGTHGYGAVEGWALGSTSTAIVRSARCSVLLVPAPAPSEAARLERNMSGTTSLTDANAWDEELRAFADRNQERRTALEVDDASIGAQVSERGYPLVGATYDHHDRRVALMFGGGVAGRPHFTRSLSGVHRVSVASRAHDDDVALCIEGEEGRALLTFEPR